MAIWQCGPFGEIFILYTVTDISGALNFESVYTKFSLISPSVARFTAKYGHNTDIGKTYLDAEHIP